jgi:hypothetical protein
LRKTNIAVASVPGINPPHATGVAITPAKTERSISGLKSRFLFFSFSTARFQKKLA